MASYAEGIYQCRVTAQGFGTSQNKLTPFFYLDIQPEYEVINDTLHELPADCRWARRVQRYITDKTIDWLIDDLRALGWEGGKLAELEGATTFVGLTVRCRCEHENATDGSGKVYERWSLYREQVGGAMEPPAKTLDKAGLRKLDAMFGDKLKSAFGKKTKATAAQPVMAAADDVDKPDPDLPF